jgi:thiol-disulfide isomerase/thioredoxin
MRNRLIAVVIAGVVIVVGATYINSRRDRSPDHADSKALESTPGVATAVASTAGDVSVEEAYEAMSARLRTLQTSAQRERSAERQQEYLREMDLVISEFIDSYPNTPQAYSAAFEAGMVNFSLQQPKLAIPHLETYIQRSTDAPRDKQAYAHFYLAESYKQVGKYDDAEAEYKIIITGFSNVDQRLTAAVNQNLAMLDGERKLTIGGEPIPFEVTSIKGEKISPSKYKGKVLLLDFWATWCAPCRQEMPTVIKVYDKYNSKGFEIVGISLDRNRQDLDSYISKNNIEWPQFYDGKFWQNEIATKYGIQSIPATLLIDKNGKIRYKSLRGHQLETAVKELLAE